MRLSIIHLGHALGLAALLLMALGCGGGGGSDTQPPTGRGAISITVQWPEITRLIPVASKAIRVQLGSLSPEFSWGKSITFIRGNGAEETVTVEEVPVGNILVRASAYPDYRILDGQIIPTGHVQAEGETQITTVLDQTTPVTITMASMIEHVVISPDPIQLQEGKSMQATAKATGGGHPLVTLASQYEWSVDDPSIATVSAEGVVTGVKAGETYLRVRETESDVGDRALVTITKPLNGIVITPNPASMAVGQSMTLTAHAYDADGNDLNIAPTGFTWTSSNTDVATVSEEGRVSYKSIGEAFITATEKQSLGSGSAQVKHGSGDVTVVIK